MESGTLSMATPITAVSGRLRVGIAVLLCSTVYFQVEL